MKWTDKEGLAAIEIMGWPTWDRGMQVLSFSDGEFYWNYTEPDFDEGDSFCHDLAELVLNNHAFEFLAEKEDDDCGVICIEKYKDTKQAYMLTARRNNYIKDTLAECYITALLEVGK